MDNKILSNIGYGLYVLTTNYNNKDNGCIINSIMQITSSPCLVAVCVSKMNFSNEIIKKTKKFNISIIDKNSQFDLFKHFGYQSGKDINKFETFKNTERSKNDILYINKNINSYFSVEVQKEYEFDTHTMFIGEIVDGKCLSDIPSVTYEYYQKSIKPKPENTLKTGWRCLICGYIYEGEVLPDDFICPLCKHGTADFEKIS